MTADTLELPAVYCDGTAYILEPAQTLSGPSGGYFGGPSEVKFVGMKRGAAGLHRVLTLHSSGIAQLEKHYVTEVPLFYGLRYSGCEVSYSFESYSAYRVHTLQPRKWSLDWPYEDYPQLLPYVPLRVKKKFACTARKFSALSWQGIEIKPKMMAVIVPPFPSGGVSVWGRSGDLEGVQMIFECDLEHRSVRAYNQCG